jgi:hypothetical protein
MQTDFHTVSSVGDLVQFYPFEDIMTFKSSVILVMTSSSFVDCHQHFRPTFRLRFKGPT